MALHTPGKSDSGSLGSTVGSQNPIKGGLQRKPNTNAKVVSTATQNIGKKGK